MTMEDKDIENRFSFKCSKKWEELTETGNERVKHCSQCGESVHLAESIEALDAHAEKRHCVALKLKENEGNKEDRSNYIEFLGDLPPVLRDTGDGEIDHLDAVGYIKPRSKNDSRSLYGEFDLPAFSGRLVPREPPPKKKSWFSRVLAFFRVNSEA